MSQEFVKTRYRYVVCWGHLDIESYSWSGAYSCNVIGLFFFSYGTRCNITGLQHYARVQLTDYCTHFKIIYTWMILQHGISPYSQVFSLLVSHHTVLWWSDNCWHWRENRTELQKKLFCISPRPFVNVPQLRWLLYLLDWIALCVCSYERFPFLLHKSKLLHCPVPFLPLHVDFYIVAFYWYVLANCEDVHFSLIIEVQDFNKIMCSDSLVKRLVLLLP